MNLAAGYVPVIVVNPNPTGAVTPLWFAVPVVIFCLVALFVIGRAIWKNR